MMHRLGMGLLGILCVALLWAPRALAEDIRVEVYRATPADELTSQEMLNDVQVDLVQLVPGVDEMGNPIIQRVLVATLYTGQPIPGSEPMTFDDGEVLFRDVNEPEPGMTPTAAIYEVELPTLNTYSSPPSAIGQVLGQNAWESTGNVYYTATPSPAPIPPTDSVEPQTMPPRDGKAPSSGPITTMGSNGNVGAKFPVVARMPEGDECENILQGVLYRDVGIQNGTFDQGLDALVPGFVGIEYSSPIFGPVVEERGAPNGSFTAANNLQDLLVDAQGQPLALGIAVARIRWRLAAGAPWSPYGDPIVLTRDVGTGAWTFACREVNVRLGAPLLGSIEGRVAREEAPGNGRIDPGEVLLDGQLVTLYSGNSEGAMLATTTTDALGRYRFVDLPIGPYRVATTGDDGDVAEARVTIRAAETATLDLLLEFTTPPPPPPCPDPTNPDCPCPNPSNPDCNPPPPPLPCAYDTCTDGLLHQVVLEADVWVGSMPAGFDIRAALLDGCGRYSRAVDRVEVSYQGAAWPYGGPMTGLDEVLSIQDVHTHAGSGWATVRMALTADFGALPDGSFGRTTRRLELMVNGRRTMVCWRFTCPHTRAGGRVGVFRVLQTLGRDAWGTCTNTPLPPVVDPGPIGGGKSHKSAKSHKSHKSHKSDKSKKSKKSKKRKPKRHKHRR